MTELQKRQLYRELTAKLDRAHELALLIVRGAEAKARQKAA